MRTSGSTPPRSSSTSPMWTNCRAPTGSPSRQAPSGLHPAGAVDSSLRSAVLGPTVACPDDGGATRSDGAVPAAACRAGRRELCVRWVTVIGGTPRSSRLHAPGTSAARSAPGAPHRAGGLPTSEPGLVAGTRELVKTDARRHPEEIDRSTTWTPPRAGRAGGSRAGGRPDAVVERPAHQSAQPVVGLEVERMLDGYPGTSPVATPPRERRD